MNRKKRSNFDKDKSEKVQFLKTHIWRTKTGQETTGNKQFWQGNVRQRTIFNMKHLKKDSSEKEDLKANI